MSEQRLEQFTLVRYGSVLVGASGLPTIYSTEWARFSFDAEVVSIAMASNIIISDPLNVGVFCIARITDFGIAIAPLNAIKGSLNTVSLTQPGIPANTEILLNHWVVSTSVNSASDPYISNKVQGIVYPKELRPKFNSQTGIGIFFNSDTDVFTTGTTTVYYRRL